MRNRFFSLLAIILTSALAFPVSVSSFAQQGTPKVLLKFERQENGKVVTINASGQKVFACRIEGLATLAEVENFKSNFVGHLNVMAVNIGETSTEGDRVSSILFAPGTKFTYVKELLIKAGITTISIDGILNPVDGLGKDQ